MQQTSTIPPVVWEAEHIDGLDQRDDLIHSVLGMADKGVPVSVWPAPLGGAPADDGDGRLRSRLQALCGRAPEDGGHVSIIHSDPESLHLDETAVYRIGRTAVGTLRVSEECASSAAALDEIWVPSGFSRRALAASGVPEGRIQVVPSSIDEELFNPDADPPPIDRAKGFAFMSALDWDYLRGLDIVLEAYVREFRHNEEVVLILKAPEPSRPSAACTGEDGGLSYWRGLEAWLLGHLRDRGDASRDREQFEGVLSVVRDVKLREELRREREAERRTADEIRNAVREEMRGIRGDIPPIKVVSRALPRCLMPQFYSACDAFVMAPRAERWGRPFLESMAVGLPTIGTRWGGHLDFMRSDNSFLIRVRALVDICNDDKLQRGGQRLAEPDVEHLRELMRRVFEYRSEAKERGARGAAHVRKRNSRTRVASLMTKRLADIVGVNQLGVAEAA